MKLGDKLIRTNGSHAWGNLPIDPMLCKSSLKGKNVPNFDDGAKCFFIMFLNKGNIYLNPLQEQQNTLLIGFFELMSLYNHLCRCDLHISIAVLGYACLMLIIRRT